MQQKGLNPSAIAVIRGSESFPNLRGEVRFFRQPECVLIEANIIGLPLNKSGFFGFHIHEGTRCSGPDFSASGSHYNPKRLPHPEHAGDLPPLLSCSGKVFLAVATDRFQIEDIIGRTVIIHNSPDDFKSQPSGNAGAKIACGIIRRG